MYTTTASVSDECLRWEQVLKRFDRAGRQGARPVIEDHLPADDPRRDAILVELVHAELERRLKAGEPARVEEYLERYPELGCDRDVLLELIAAEYDLRRRRQRGLAPDEYLARFPQYRAELASRLSAAAVETPPGRAGPTTPEDRARAARKDAATPTAPPLPTLAGYELHRELGRGGMGVVYKARQVGLNRLVALKMIRTGPWAGPQELARFRAEAEAVARLQHPHIVQIHEIGEQDGLPYLCLEFVAGGSLAQKLAGSPLPAGEAARLVETLAWTVSYAHQQGIIHRDLKPANILLSVVSGQSSVVERERGGALQLTTDNWQLTTTPKITDFGLAKRLDSAQGTCTPSGIILGTPSYMAPEQAEGKKEVGPAADVYALGAILYECLTGRPPFQAATVLDTLEQVRSQEPVPPLRLQPKLPRDLETICLKCLEKQPGRRYAGAQELADDLRRFLAGEPIRARAIGAGERVRKWARRRPATAALAALAILVVLGLAAAGLLHSQHQRRHRAEILRLIRAGQEASANENWSDARLHLHSAIDRIGSKPGLADLRDHAAGLLVRAEQRLAYEAARRRARETYQAFMQQRDAVLFQTLLAGLNGGTAEGPTAGDGAQEALKLLLDGVQRQPPLAFTEREKAEVRVACYELLLILAEAVAQPLPGQAPGQRHDRLRQALALLDRVAPLHPPTRVFHLRRADYLARLGDDHAASQERQRAEQLAPADALDHFLLGEERLRRGEPAPAARHFEDALRRQPDHFWARYFLAVCHLNLQRPAEAKVGLTACAGQQPGFVWTYLLRGFAHGELNEFEYAAADFRKALDLGPDETARYAVYAYRGVVRIRQAESDRKKLDEAVADLLRAIRLKPGQFHAYVSLAQAYQMQGKWDEAIAQLDRAIEREPARGALYRARARLHLKRHQLADAVRDLEQAMGLEPAPGEAPEKGWALGHGHKVR